MKQQLMSGEAHWLGEIHKFAQNERMSPKKGDHFKRKMHLPTINFQGTFLFFRGVVHPDVSEAVFCGEKT